MAGSYTALLGSIPGGGPFNHEGYPKMKTLFTLLAAASAMTLAACSAETPAPPVEQPVPEEVLVEEVVAEEVVEEVVAEEVQPLLEEAVAEEAAPQ